MSFTAQNIMTSVAYRAHKDITMAESDDDTDVKEAVKQAILYIQMADDWQAHRKVFTLSTTTTPALTASTYNYAIRTLLSDFRKLDGDSVRYGTHPIEYRESAAQIDRDLGPQWKDGSEDGNPDYCTLLGNDLWLAPNLSSSWISSYGANGVRGYYWATEDVTSVDATTGLTTWEDATLLMPHDFYMELVSVALIFLLQTEDDDNFRMLLQQWEQVGLTRLRGYDEAPKTNEPVRSPRWARGRIA